MKLDYKIKTLEGRKALVDKICSDPGVILTPVNLETLADYLLHVAPVEKHELNTSNRMVTINKRETSLQGLQDKFQPGGQDSIVHFIREDKNMILSPKISITKKDLREIPFLKEVREAIDALRAIPVKNYIVHQAIIELSQSQYIIKEAFLKPIRGKTSMHSSKPEIDWDLFIDFTNKTHVKHFLQLYSRLKNSSAEALASDMYWMLKDFEDLTDRALKNNPLLRDIVILKIDGMKGTDIRAALEVNHGKTFSVEYISSLFNNKIPRLIANLATKEKLIFHYTFEEKGEFKTCTRCGQTKLRHSEFFTRNSSSKFGFYSLCKECRNKK